MGAGEMSLAEFTTFLQQILGPAAERCRDGAIAFVCMDWRHAGELTAAGKVVFTELKNLCVWNKSNAGMGSFYRSKHELVFVFKKGTAPHVNSFGLGETGRPRSNVWDYPGVSSIGASRMEELAMHPTVKPVGLIAAAEAQFGADWDMAPSVDYFRRILPGVGAFRIQVTAVQSMFKLSQEQPLPIRERDAFGESLELALQCAWIDAQTLTRSVE